MTVNTPLHLTRGEKSGVFIWISREKPRAENPPSARERSPDRQLDQLVYELYGLTEEEIPLFSQNLQDGRFD